jgi:hypothetical protein
MINGCELINRLSRERTRHGKDLKTDFILGVMEGLALAMAMVREMMADDKARAWCWFKRRKR